MTVQFCQDIVDPSFYMPQHLRGCNFKLKIEQTTLSIFCYGVSLKLQRHISRWQEKSPGFENVAKFLPCDVEKKDHH